MTSNSTDNDEELPFWKRMLLRNDSDISSDDDLLTKILIKQNHLLVTSKRWPHIRVQWDTHVQKLLHEKSFARTYRMTFSSFTKLVHLITPVACNSLQFSRTEEPVLPELLVE